MNKKVKAIIQRMESLPKTYQKIIQDDIYSALETRIQFFERLPQQ